MHTAELQPTDMAGWPPGAQHFRTSNDRNFVVLVNPDLSEAVKLYVNQLLEARGEQLLPQGEAVPAVTAEEESTLTQHRVVPQPTVIIECSPEGQAISMTPLWSFPAGTPAAAALLVAGYEVQ